MKFKCIGCGFEFDDKLDLCPKCGCKRKKPKSKNDHFLIPTPTNEEDEILFINEDEGFADIIMFGDVGMEVDGDHIAKLMRGLEDNEKIKVINQRINSGGGAVINGLSIVSANLNSTKEIRTFNEGVAASMGGIILMSGEKVFMNDFATLMIHEPTICGETIEKTEDENVKKGLIAIRDSLSKIIQNRSGKTKKQVDKIMNEEMWFNAKDSKNEGFIDKVVITKDKKNESFVDNIKESYVRKVGNKWEVVIIKSGLSKNGFYYTDEVLEGHKSMFEGTGVYTHSFGNYYAIDLAHRPEKFEDPNKLILNKIGWIKDVQFKRENAQGYLVGNLHCMNSTLNDVLNNTWEEDQSKMPELSVDIDGDGYINNGYRIVTKIVKIRSVDLVDDGSAGGKFLRLVAGTLIKEDKMDFIKQLLALIKEGKIKMDDTKDKTDEQIIDMIKESLGIKEEDKVDLDLTKYVTIEDVKKAIEDSKDDDDDGDKKKDEPKKDDDDNDDGKVVEDLSKKVDGLKEKIAMQDSELTMKEELAKDNILPSESKTRIVESYTGRIFTRDEIKKAIQKEKEYLESLSASGTLKIKEGVSMIKVTDTPVDQKHRALDMLIDPDLATEDNYKGTPQFSGIREAFEAYTGLKVDEARSNPWKIKEASTTDFPIALGTSMNKKAIKEYNYFKIKQVWTKFVKEEVVNNTNQQTLFRFGEFEDLATVAEAGEYQELTTPSEDNPTYTPIKKGNVFTLTEEMLINDNLRAMRQWPRKMAQAAIRTLSKYVFNLVTGCDGSSTLNSQAIYDGGVLYSTVHGNLATANLSANALRDGVTAMNDYADTDSAEPLFIEPKYLLTIVNNRAVAWDITSNELTQANANGGSIQNVYSQNYAIEPLIAPTAYFCGSTNFWALIADPRDVEAVTVGYVNKNTPEILLQDNPTVATVFTNDQIKYKVKFRYGGAITDWRGFYGRI